MIASGLPKGCTAFAGSRRIATGALIDVATKAKEALQRDARIQLLIFDNSTSEQVEVDFRGTLQDVVRRVAATVPAEIDDSEKSPELAESPRGPGRPKLGVVAREVTLLPRHWDWLSNQPGGASVALRKLVEQARRANEGKDRILRAQEATNRFMTAMAGNRPGFEEATRALFARNQQQFEELTQPWPTDIRHHARELAAPAFTTDA